MLLPFFDRTICPVDEGSDKYLTNFSQIIDLELNVALSCCLYCKCLILQIKLLTLKRNIEYKLYKTTQY
jgi:hypothetical protein